MTIESTILKIRRELIRAFALLDGWFDESSTFLMYRPPGGDRTPWEILEHVVLTNHNLLVLIDKASEKAREHALKKPLALSDRVRDYVFEDPRTGKDWDGAFNWNARDYDFVLRQRFELRDELRDQLNRCLIQLELLANGEGILYRDDLLPVNDPGKWDLYQYLYMLASHTRRSVEQLENTQIAFSRDLLNNSLSTN